MDNSFTTLVGADVAAPDTAAIDRLRGELAGLTQPLDLASGDDPAASEANPTFGASQCFCMVPDEG